MQREPVLCVSYSESLCCLHDVHERPVKHVEDEKANGEHEPGPLVDPDGNLLRRHRGPAVAVDAGRVARVELLGVAAHQGGVLDADRDVPVAAVAVHAGRRDGRDVGLRGEGLKEGGKRGF